MSQRALCVTTNLALRKVLRRSLSAAGAVVDFVDRADDLAGEEGPFVDLVVVDDVAQAAALVPLLPRLGPHAKVVMLGGPFDAATTLDVMRQDGFDHVLGDENDVSEDELLVTSVKLLGGDLLGVEKYLTWGARLHARDIASYDEKRLAIRDVTELARMMGCRRQLVARVETVTDELLMNALYDAPASRFGCRPLFQGKGRPGAGPVTDQVARLRYGCDGRYFAVAVRDSFGELRKSNVLDHLERARDEKGLPKLGGEEGGGGGLGLYFILNSVTRFIANVEPGRATEVICLFDLRGAAKDYHYRAKSLSIFVAPPPA